jgi:hypothetical protein
MMSMGAQYSEGKALLVYVADSENDRATRQEISPELLNDNLRIDSISEPLHGQALIVRLAVEGLVGTVLRGLSWIDAGGIDTGLQQPAQYGRWSGNLDLQHWNVLLLRSGVLKPWSAIAAAFDQRLRQ